MSLPLDILRYLPVASRMTVREILRMARLNRRLQETISYNRDFWLIQAGKWLTSHPDKLVKVTLEDLKRHLHSFHSCRSDLYLLNDPPMSYLCGFFGYDKLESTYLRHASINCNLTPLKLYIYGSIAGNHMAIWRDYIDTQKRYIHQELEQIVVFHEAVLAGNTEIIEILYDQQTGFDEVLYCAIRTTNVDIIQLITKHILNGAIDYSYLLGYVYVPSKYRTLATRYVGHYSIPCELNDISDIADMEIIETVIQKSDPHGLPVRFIYILSNLIDTEVTPGRFKLFERLLAEPVNLDYSGLLIRATCQCAIDYLKVLLPLSSEVAIRDSIEYIDDIETLIEFKPYLTVDSMKNIFYRRSNNSALVKYFIRSGLTPEEFDDGFRKTVLASDLNREVLVAYLPLLNDEQRAFGARIARRTGNMILQEFFLL